MYFIVFVRDQAGRKQNGTVVGHARSLEEAKKRRMVTGDIVFRQDGHIESSYDWLWDSEKENELAYARRCIQRQYVYNGPFPRISA
jgi:hypothetical protein